MACDCGHTINSPLIQFVCFLNCKLNNTKIGQLNNLKQIIIEGMEGNEKFIQQAKMSNIDIIELTLSNLLHILMLYANIPTEEEIQLIQQFVVRNNISVEQALLQMKLQLYNYMPYLISSDLPHHEIFQLLLRHGNSTDITQYCNYKQLDEQTIISAFKEFNAPHVNVINELVKLNINIIRFTVEHSLKLPQIFEMMINAGLDISLLVSQLNLTLTDVLFIFLQNQLESSQLVSLYLPDLVPLTQFLNNFSYQFNVKRQVIIHLQNNDQELLSDYLSTIQMNWPEKLLIMRSCCKSKYKVEVISDEQLDFENTANLYRSKFKTEQEEFMNKMFQFGFERLQNQMLNGINQNHIISKLENVNQTQSKDTNALKQIIREKEENIANLETENKKQAQIIDEIQRKLDET
ncbi:Conserved_hypothetical protein [Hexamita inflata]|uniref:Uncharacterized protein n=1 Tax=Hexamita inflata TaxID=28002 RepID=A0AA86NLQ8_9EUKA|nr:Conserved hypothetical protein [Hexamita inflata]